MRKQVTILLYCFTMSSSFSMICYYLSFDEPCLGEVTCYLKNVIDLPKSNRSLCPRKSDSKSIQLQRCLICYF